MSAASISSEHVNLLVYRYLLESGFTHSSFAFHQESNIKDAVKVKPGALLSLLHKSLLYIQVESHLDSTCSNSFDLISTHRCSLPTNKSTLRSLTGHLGEVYASAWNPVFPILATCSGDGTARIWNIPDSPDSPSSIAPIVLVHTREKDTRDVTTLEWNVFLI